MKYEELGKGIVKRTERRVLGLFIDGTSLDRATRRLSRKVDMTALVRGVTSGVVPTVARYYTLIPYEDDSRQRAFLDAVSRAGLSVVVKRLPPKGVTRQVLVDVEIASDIIAFALGLSAFSDLSTYKPEDLPVPSNFRPTVSTIPLGAIHHRSAPAQVQRAPQPQAPAAADPPKREQKESRIVTVVCPSRDLAYPISLVKELGVDTVTADFGQFNTGDLLKSAAKWIDLSDSETIWRE